MARQKLTLSRTEAQQTAAWETGAHDEYDELPLTPDYDAEAADVCPTCGDPLSWHERACTAPAAKPTVAEPAPAKQDAFTYAVGSLVLADEHAQPSYLAGPTQGAPPGYGVGAAGAAVPVSRWVLGLLPGGGATGGVRVDTLRRGKPSR